MSTPPTGRQCAGRRRFVRYFGDRPCVFLAVVYATGDQQALQNVESARNSEADGVFLVNYGLDSRGLLEVAKLAVERHPHFFIGVNCLDLSIRETVRRIPSGLAGVWTSRESVRESVGEVDLLRRARESAGWDGLIFAPAPSHSKLIEQSDAANAPENTYGIDVPTIQGVRPAALKSRCRKLKSSSPDQPLGLAAAVDSIAIDEAAPYVNSIMTSASSDHSSLSRLDSGEARRLAARVRDWPS